MALKQDGLQFVLCPSKQGNIIEAIVLNRPGYAFCPINRARVSNFQKPTHAQILVENPPLLRGPAV